MLNIFNKISTLPSFARALKSAFAATKAGVNVNDVATAVGVFREKLDNFSGAVCKENSKARTIFAENAFLITPDGTINLPKTWKEYFQVVETALAKTEVEVGKLASEEETASFGRMKYRADLFSNWYNAQDARLFPVFESLGKIYGIHTELVWFFPLGEHKMTVKGKEISIELS